MTTRVFVALGANLGNTVEQLTRARRAISAMNGVHGLRASSLYQSAAVGTQDAQPDYLNAVVSFDTVFDLSATWRQLAQIERELGRTRAAERNAARTIDIDLLLFGEITLQSAELTVPHPRMHERAFVLAPLVELDPQIQIPNRGAANSLLVGLAAQRCEPVAESGAWS